MSSPITETFLKQLEARLLPSAPRNRQIREELMDHWICRFEELVASGHSTDSAQQKVLNEVGNTEKLVDELNDISHEQSRRRIMHYTATSSLIASALAVLAMMYWPQPGENGTTGTVIAQSAPPQASDKTAESAKEKPESTLAQKAKTQAEETLEALQAKNEVRFTDTPLIAFAQGFSDTWKIPVVIENERLAEQGLSATEATINLEFAVPISGSSVLRRALTPLQLGYFIDEEVVIITTENDLELRQEVRVYDCRDLISLSDVERLPFRSSHSESYGFSGGLGPAGTNATSRSTVVDSLGGEAGAAEAPASGDAEGRMMSGGGRGGFGMMMMGGGISEMPGAMASGSSILAGRNDAEGRLLRVLLETIFAHGSDARLSSYEGLLIVDGCMNDHMKVENMLKLLRQRLAIRRGENLTTVSNISY